MRIRTKNRAFYKVNISAVEGQMGNTYDADASRNGKQTNALMNRKCIIQVRTVIYGIRNIPQSTGTTAIPGTYMSYKQKQN